MRVVALRRDIVFYPLALAMWAAFILMRHMHYSYYDSPLPSVQARMQISDALYKGKAIDSNIEELRKSLEEETETTERGHIEHNLGTAFYDQYKSTQAPALLDSAQAFYEKSIETLSSVPRFYYNLGRVYTERRDHLNARKYYERTLSLDPQHVLALHNLALLNFYELGNAQAARELLEKALSIRADLPICNYVLGEIALRENQVRKAHDHFRQEVNSFALYSGGEKRVPVSASAMRFAAAKSHLELAILYSTKLVDAKQAQANFHAYLRLEPDKQRRDAAIAEMKKYWVLRGE